MIEIHPKRPVGRGWRHWLRVLRWHFRFSEGDDL